MLCFRSSVSGSRLEASCSCKPPLAREKPHASPWLYWVNLETSRHGTVEF